MRQSQRPGAAQRFLVKVQREAGYELKRVFLESDLGIIQEVIDRRYRKGELLVDRQSYRTGAGGGEGAGIVPCDVREKLFIKLELSPLPRVILGQCRCDQVELECFHVNAWICLELLTFVVQIGRDIKLTLLLLEQSRPDTAAVFLLEYKALGIIVIERKHLQIIATRAKVFVSFAAQVEDIGNRRFCARLRRLSCTQRKVYRRAELRVEPTHR